MRRQFAPPTARSDVPSAGRNLGRRRLILASWFGSSLTLAFLLWVAASLNRSGDFERPIRSWHIATVARRTAIQIGSERQPGEFDEKSLREEISARLALPLVDGFGRELMIEIPPRTPGVEWSSRVRVVSLGEDGIRHLVGGDDIEGSSDWHSTYRIPVSDGFYWARYRFLSRVLLAFACVPALAGAGLWLLRARKWAGAVLLAALTLTALAGWAWDGPLWSRSLQHSPGFVLCLVGVLSVVGLIHLVWYCATEKPSATARAPTAGAIATD